MLSVKFLNRFVLIVFLVFFCTVNSYGAIADAKSWRDFGERTLYFFSSDKCQLPNKFQLQKDLVTAFAKPNSQESVLMIERFLAQALEGYEQNTFAWLGRVPFDINPGCILGLYLTDKFPDTKLSSAGKRMFAQSVERSAMAVLGATTLWQKLLEEKLLKTNAGSNEPLFDCFESSEVPFLLIYLIKNGSSGTVRQIARKNLAQYLEKNYGLEPALRQYSILLNQKDNTIDKSTKLKVAGYLEQTGAIYSEEERQGLEAIRNMSPAEDNDKTRTAFLSQLDKLHNSLFVLFHRLRSSTKQGSAGQLGRYAENVYSAATMTEVMESDLLNTFRQMKKQQTIRLLFAEYNWARSRFGTSEPNDIFLNLEPILFTAQLLDKDSFEQISSELSAEAPAEYVKGQMYRFSKFAQRLGRPYILRMALDVAVRQINNVNDNVELLDDIAETYLTGNNHQKAIEIYDRIVQGATEANNAQEAQLKIIKIYAEQLKLYDRAIAECQNYLKKFPNSDQISQVEFLLGKLAYLSKDYTGAVGGLDSFCRKYPDNPQISEAMTLAAISRMSEGNTQDAIERFGEIIGKYPDGDLAAKSKFLIGYTLVSEQKYSEALEIFKQLIEQFPKSQYVKQAQSFINRLGKVSR